MLCVQNQGRVMLRRSCCITATPRLRGEIFAGPTSAASTPTTQRAGRLIACRPSAAFRRIAYGCQIARLAIHSLWFAGEPELNVEGNLKSTQPPVEPLAQFGFAHR